MAFDYYYYYKARGFCNVGVVLTAG